MRKTAAAAATTLIAAVAAGVVLSGGAATATASVPTVPTPQAGLTQPEMPTLVDPSADLSAGSGHLNDSWYLTAQVRAGGHRYGFLAHYVSSGDAAHGVASSAVSLTDETTGWYTRSEVTLPPRAGLSGAPGVDIRTRNITWTGDTTTMRLIATVPQGRIDVTLYPRGAVLYDMGTGYFPVFAHGQFPNTEYAFPTTSTHGTLTLDGRTQNLEGDSWVDRQWGPLPDFAAVKAGWTWMDLQLSNGDSVSLADTHTASGEQTFATVLHSDGTETLTPATITPDATSDWTSPQTGTTYPTRWTVTLPGEHADLRVTTATKDQELVTPAPRYEGAAAVTGIYRGGHVSGHTYVEVAGVQ